MTGAGSPEPCPAEGGGGGGGVVVEVVVVGGGVGRNLLDDPMLRRGELLVLEPNLRREFSMPERVRRMLPGGEWSGPEGSLSGGRGGCLERLSEGVPEVGSVGDHLQPGRPLGGGGWRGLDLHWREPGRQTGLHLLLLDWSSGSGSAHTRPVQDLLQSSGSWPGLLRLLLGLHTDPGHGVPAPGSGPNLQLHPLTPRPKDRVLPPAES